MRMLLLLMFFLASSLLIGCKTASPFSKANSNNTAGASESISPQPAEVAKPQIIRVMSYNIHHGRGTDGKVDIERIAQVIKEAKPDIVGVQELDRGVQRSGGIDEIGEIARITGMTYYFDKNIEFQGGAYGNAVLTRFPILQQTNSYYKSVHPGERRAVQQVVVDVNGRKLVFLNTHMDYRPEDEERWMNMSELEQVVKTYHGLPMILTGDLNDDPDSRTHKRFKEMFVDAWEAAGEGDGFTYVGSDRSKRLDYVLVSKSDALKVETVRVIQTDASDHRPVVAEIRLQ